MEKEQIVEKIKEILKEITCEDDIDVEETLSFYDIDDQDQEFSEEVESEFNVKCPFFTGEMSVDEFCERIVTTITENEQK